MRRLLRALVRRPVALASVLALLALYGSMATAEFLSPYTPGTTFKHHSYHPPSLTWYSPELGFGPQVQEWVLVDQINWKYVRVTGRFHRVRLFAPGPGYRLWGIIATDIHLFGTGAPYEPGGVSWREGGKSWPVFLFGADHLGRDLFTRVLHGGRISLTIGFIGISISLSLAILFGGLAGYYGGWIDWLIMRLAEFFILIPGLYMILFLRSILSRNLDSGQSFLLITVILSFVGWPGSARLIRGLAHSIKREDFISAAALQGIPSVVIIFKQIIPQMLYKITQEGMDIDRAMSWAEGEMKKEL